MNKGFSLAFLLVGGALVVYGVMASQSLSSDISRFFTGTFSDKTVWLLVGGGVLTILGLSGLLRESR